VQRITNDVDVRACVDVRSRILSDNSLRIENVQASDDGVFVCRMENSFGSQEAESRVTVLCKSQHD